MNACDRREGTYRFINLGCPKNLVDAERAAASLEAIGWHEAPSAEAADLIVVTTCAFIADAIEESLEEIIEVSSNKDPSQRLAVVGCLVTREGSDKLKALLPGVDIFCSVREMKNLSRYLGLDSEEISDVSAPGRKLFTPAHLAYLKISEGCSNRCAYCTIPIIRGDLRSRPPLELISEARELADLGVRELVVVAQDTTAYGFDFRSSVTLYDLLEAISGAARFDWIRLLYAHPAHLDAGRISELIRGGILLPYLDVPIQHASDRILQRMGRPYRRAELEELFGTLRSEIPDLILRTTVMVGFPGERESDFGELLDFLENVEFDHVGVFEYSLERGTEAARFRSRVPRDISARRREEILQRQMDISHARLGTRLGSILEVLVDEYLCKDMRPDPKFSFSGRFYGQAYEIDGITYLAGESLAPGKIIRARIIEAGPYDLFAELQARDND